MTINVGELAASPQLDALHDNPAYPEFHGFEVSFWFQPQHVTTDWHGLVKTDTFELLLWREWNTGDYRLWLRFDGNPNWHAIDPIAGPKWYWNQQRKISLWYQLHSTGPRFLIQVSEGGQTSRHYDDVDLLGDIPNGVVAAPSYDATSPLGDVLVGAGLYGAHGWFDDLAFLTLPD